MRGHIHRRKTGQDRVLWYAVVDGPRHPDGRRRQDWGHGYRTRREAERELNRKLSSIEDGSYVAPSALTLSAYVERHWLKAIRGRVKPTTFDGYQRTLANHVLPTLGHRRLQSITSSDLNALYGTLLADGRRPGGRPGGPLSNKTVHNVHLVVSKVLGDALDDDLVALNVAQKAKPPKPGRDRYREIKAWTPEQLRVFLQSVEGHELSDAFLVSAMTGMRRSEILGLRWQDLDFDHHRLSVRHTLVVVRGTVVSSTPKSHEARVVDLDSATLGVLRRRRADHRGLPSASDTEGAREGLVFARVDGRTVHPDNFSKAFARAVAQTDLPRITLHDLRHTHATIALVAGVPIKVVSERLGHASPEFTMRVYQHVLPSLGREAASAIATAVFPSTDADHQVALVAHPGEAVRQPFDETSQSAVNAEGPTPRSGA